MYVGDTSGHAGAQVDSRFSKNDDTPTGHVFKSVVSNAFDHGNGSRVSNHESFTDDSV